MTTRTSAAVERVLERRAKHKLAVIRHVEEVRGNVAATCRYYGISRQAYYGWLKRYETEGADGLRDRSSAPHYSPNATRAEVVEKILWLRQQYRFGTQKIAMYLKRYHDLTISSSGVWRILHKVGLGGLPASQRHKRKDTKWKRYEKQRPGHAAGLTYPEHSTAGQHGMPGGDEHVDYRVNPFGRGLSSPSSFAAALTIASSSSNSRMRFLAARSSALSIVERPGSSPRSMRS